MRDYLLLPGLVVAGLTLAGCDGGGSGDQASAPAESAAEAPAETMSTADDLKQAASDMMEKAAEALKIDASSLESFKQSLADMRENATSEEKSQLSEALASLAKGTATKEGGLMDAAKKVASGQSIEETVYEAYGSKLDGLTLEGLLGMAGN